MSDLAYLIPDTQVREGVPNPLAPIAHHICAIRPTMLIHLGDHWDMPSLSKYDKGKKSHRALTYLKDISAGNLAMTEFWDIIHSSWPNFHDQCKSVILVGNHEERIDRAKEYGPDELVGLLDRHPRDYTHWDTVVPFLKVFTWHDIEFCHYFQNTNSALPIGNAKMLLTKGHTSRVAGHKQGFDYAEMPCGSQGMIQSLIIGSCYYHEEAYKTHTRS